MALVAALVAVAAACADAPPVVTLGPATDVVSVAEPDLVPPLRFRGADLVDGAGRVVLIHGVNSVAKRAPFITEPADGALDPADLERLAADGVNGIRLGVWPAALMPAPGQVDPAYLDRVRAVVDTVAGAGMWVLLDLHQDVFEGMPSWATTPEAAALDTTLPEGLADAIGWSAAYLTPRSLRQWDDWWANAPVTPGTGVVDAYADGVAALAGRMADAPNVIGVELINEPFPGTPVVSCVLGGCPDLDARASALYDRITARVRAAAPDLPVWWEPEAMFPVYAAAQMPPPAHGQVGLSFHTYCLYTDGGEPVQPSPEANAWCDARFTEAVDRARGQAAAWAAPAMLTEFGASASPLNVTLPARLADDHLLSWFHWHNGRYPDVVESQLVRTSAQATAGRPLSQRFEPATGDYELRFRADHAVTAPTSIVVPRRAYPAGYTVVVDGGEVTSAPDAGRLTVEADPTADVVTVTVRRA